MTEDTKKPSDLPITHPICGLAWAEFGNPFFLCIIGEKRHDATTSFITPDPTLEIVGEEEIKTFRNLTDTLESLPSLYHCNTIYTVMEPKYLTFIRNLNNWRRVENVKIALKPTKSSSLESSLLKVKELIMDKRLLFPPNSIIKSQLSTFSKTSLKDADNFYAVRALTMVIDVFGKPKVAEMSEIKDSEDGKEVKPPNMKAWW